MKNQMMTAIALSGWFLASPALAQEAPAAQPPSAPPPATTGTAAPPAPATQPAPPQPQLQYRIGQNPPQPVDLAALRKDPVAALMNIVGQTFTLAKTQQNKAEGNLQWFVPPGVKDLLADLPPLQLITQVLADGQGQTDIVMNPLTRDITDGKRTGKLEWQGITGQVLYAADLSAPRATMQLPGWHLVIEKDADLQLAELRGSAALDAKQKLQKMDVALKSFAADTDGNTLRLDGLQAMIDIKPLASGLRVGNTETSMASLHMKKADNSELSLKNMKVSGHANAEKTGIGYVVRTTLEKLNLPKEMSTGSLAESSFELELGVSNLLESVLLDLQNQVDAMQQQGLSDQLLAFAVLGKLSQAGPELLKNSPKAELRTLRLTTKEGTLTGNLTVSLDGSKLQGDGKKPLAMDQNAIKAAVLADGNFFIPQTLAREVYTQRITKSLQQAAATPPPKPADKPADSAKEPAAPPTAPPSAEEIAKKVDAELQALQDKKWLLPEPGGFRATVQFKDGKFTVNGQEQPLPWL